MALPQDGQNANGLTKVTEIPKGKELIFIDPTTNEGGIITLEDLTTQILKNLTSQTFALDQGTKTLPAALNELNSKKNHRNNQHIKKSEYFKNRRVCIQWIRIYRPKRKHFYCANKSLLSAIKTFADCCNEFKNRMHR